MGLFLFDTSFILERRGRSLIYQTCCSINHTFNRNITMACKCKRQFKTCECWNVSKLLCRNLYVINHFTRNMNYIYKKSNFRKRSEICFTQPMGREYYFNNKFWDDVEIHCIKLRFSRIEYKVKCLFQKKKYNFIKIIFVKLKMKPWLILTSFSFWF